MSKKGKATAFISAGLFLFVGIVSLCQGYAAAFYGGEVQIVGGQARALGLLGIIISATIIISYFQRGNRK
jgi:hypothetical protein